MKKPYVFKKSHDEYYYSGQAKHRAIFDKIRKLPPWLNDTMPFSFRCSGQTYFASETRGKFNYFLFQRPPNKIFTFFFFFFFMVVHSKLNNMVSRPAKGMTLFFAFSPPKWTASAPYISFIHTFRRPYS